MTAINALTTQIKLHGQQLGFAHIGIVTPVILEREKSYLEQWLQKDRCGTMTFMQRNATARVNPTEFIPWVKSIICCRMDYFPQVEQQYFTGISEYALCQDYHIILQDKLQQLASYVQKLTTAQCRTFCDSAPIAEKALAAQAGLGWIGKNTLLINDVNGSRGFLGEIFTDLVLPPDKSLQKFCGDCQICLRNCPTKALYAPYSLDARRCIAYLTIEHKGSIPEELRPAIGTRIFGCDACQSCCPYNQQAQQKENDSFMQLPQFNNINLAQLFLWDEAIYKINTQQTPLARLGYERWLRNIAIALGNAPPSPENKSALQARLNYHLQLVREHTKWAWRKINSDY